MTPQIPDCGEYRDPRGRTPVDPAIFQQPHSMVLACSGQSMLGNFAQLTPYNPWTGVVYELCTITGLIYQVTEGKYPTMGMDGWYSGEVPGVPRSSVLPYWGDMLVANGKCSRVLLAAHNIGGTFAAQWCPIGNLFQRSLGTLQWLQSLGIPPTHWVEMLGQADVNASTVPVTYNGNVLLPASSAQNFADYMHWKWSSMRGVGMTCPITMGQGAHWTGVSNVQTARYAMIKHGQLIAAQAYAETELGPDDDEWPDAGYRVDGVHPADGMRYYQMQRWLPAFPVL